MLRESRSKVLSKEKMKYSLKGHKYIYLIL